MYSPARRSGKVYFGEFELDLETAELRSNGSQSILPGKPFQVLITLLDRPGQLITREELKKQLWPSDTFVDFDVGLNKAVNRLRDALKDSVEHPRFIETLPRKGYRFICVVENRHWQTGSERRPAPASSSEPASVQDITSDEPPRPASRPYGLTGSGETLVYEFGGFRLDPTEHRLLREGQVVPLTAKAFELLVCLVERHGRLVERQSLMSALWPDTIVEEANLALEISALRKALDERGNGDSVIQTVPTKGYRFVAAVTEAPLIAHPVQAPNRGWWRRWPVLWVGGGIVLFLGAVLFVDRILQLSRTEAPKLMPLTALSGFEVSPTFSPDGEQVAFMWDGEREDNSDIYLKMIGSADVRRLTTDPGSDFAPSWSPDGRQIAFLHGLPSGNFIHVISPLGGSDRQVSDFPVSEGPIAWSPDSQYVAAGRIFRAANTPNEETGGIYLVSVQSGEARAVTRTALNLSPETMESNAIQHSPAFSPDGRHLAFASCTPGCDVEVVDVNASLSVVGPARRLTKESVFRIGGLTWSRDGKSVIYDTEAIPFVQYLWRIAADGEHPSERIEVGAGAFNPAIAHSRDRLAFARNWIDIDIYRFQAGRPSQPLVASSALPDAGAQYSPDGQRIVFASGRSGDGSEIWVAAADGSGVQQLTNRGRPFSGAPHWSPDGRRIAFDSLDADGHWHIWTVAADGGAPQRLTRDTADEHVPTWSHDGRWVYFSAKSEGAQDIFRVSSAGGVKQRVTKGGSAGYACESADGKSLLYQAKPEGPSPLLALPLDGGPARQLVACVRSTAFAERPQGIYYLGCEPSSGVWTDSPANRPVHLMDRVTGEDKLIGVLEQFEPGWPVFGLGVSPDGTSILYTRRVREGYDLMLVENFR